MAAMVPSHYTQAYNYDQYGNMSCSGNYCNSTLTFDASTNRINTTGYSYDAAGDLTRDGSGTGTHSFEWDAEQRMKTVDGGSTGTLTYNAMGQRVQKNIGGTSYYYLHDAFGNVSVVRSASSLLEKIIPGANAKYYQNGAGWKTDYLHGNPLGTTQIVTQADTSVEEERIFYPFGILRWQSGGSQDARFASMQERDSETVSWQDSLDWTPNRTFGENMGRWFSPDPAVAGQVPLAGDITNPQSLNRYAYVGNNPTRLVDPTGLCSEPTKKPCKENTYSEDNAFDPTGGRGDLSLLDATALAFVYPADLPEGLPDLFALQVQGFFVPVFGNWDAIDLAQFQAGLLTPGYGEGTRFGLRGPHGITTQILLGQNGCSDFFASAAGSFTHGVLPTGAVFFDSTPVNNYSGEANVTAYTTQNTGWTQPIFLNTNGGFFNTMFGQKLHFVDRYLGGTIAAQITTYLHEEAHTVGAIPADTDNTFLSQANTKTIVNLCGQQIDQAAR